MNSKTFSELVDCFRVVFFEVKIYGLGVPVGYGIILGYLKQHL
ncbi:MAG: hypothetical protein OCD00_19080 [Colwellia sp.]